jgi:hypothetical protein
VFKRPRRIKAEPRQSEAVSGKRSAFSAPPKAAPQAKPKPKALPPHASDDALTGTVLAPASPDIPPHVWNMLQEAGEAAASRLVELLTSPRFASYSPQSQRGLIELALTRAYGLPIRKALNLNLSTSDADAVAASLADLAQSLPEHVRHSLRTNTPPETPFSPPDTLNDSAG